VIRESVPNKWLIASTVMLASTMSAIDSSIVNVAMPHMRGALNASVEEIAWVATGYMLSTVCIMPIAAFLSSWFGRRRFLFFSIVLFTATSMLCGAAWNLSSMVLFRVLQGVGGGALVPVAHAIMRETFPPEEQGVAMGIYGLGVVMGPAFGPVLGGWLTDNLSWPWIFYINIPVGILNLVMIGRYIHDPPYLVREKGRIDFAGLLLMVVSLSSLMFVLERGEREGWLESPMIVFLIVLSLLTLVAFILQELASANPIVNLRIFKDRTFSLGTMTIGIINVGLLGSLFILPLFVQQVLGYTAMDAGILLMPRSLAMAVSMPIVGRLYNRVGLRLLSGAGIVVTTYSLWMLSRCSLSMGMSNLILPQILQGFGFGMIFVPLNTTTLLGIERSRMTSATGLFNVVRVICATMGIALTATLYTHGISEYRSTLVANVSQYREIARAWEGTVSGGMMARGFDADTAHGMALRLLEGSVLRQAEMLSFNNVHFLIMILFALCMPVILLMKKSNLGHTTVVEMPVE
jgi:DHA2 family multidrug resistance protein